MVRITKKGVQCQNCKHKWIPYKCNKGKCSKCKSRKLKPVDIAYQGIRCLRCEHEWVPLKTWDKIRICPGCKSPYFDVPRK